MVMWGKLWSLPCVQGLDSVDLVGLPPLALPTTAHVARYLGPMDSGILGSRYFYTWMPHARLQLNQRTPGTHAISGTEKPGEVIETNQWLAVAPMGNLESWQLP